MIQNNNDSNNNDCRAEIMRIKKLNKKNHKYTHQQQ